MIQLLLPERYSIIWKGKRLVKKMEYSLDVKEIVAAISKYESYMKIFVVLTIILVLLLFLQWKYLNIPYAFASVTGIAAHKAIRKYDFSKMNAKEGKTVELKKRTRTKYKNFIIREEILLAAELPKELKVL